MAIRPSLYSLCKVVSTGKLVSKMTDTTLGISVIICTYSEERWDDLVAAVTSVQEQTLLPIEIIVVIDHNPGLLKKGRKHMPGLLLVENTEARGLSGARNCGILAARGSVLVFLDDDAQASPDWLQRLCEAYRDARVLGCGGPVFPLWLHIRPAWFPEEFH